MALTPEQIVDIAAATQLYNRALPAIRFARAIEAEVRKADTDLIRQMLEALEQSNATLWEEDDDPECPASAAITAARARLGES